MKRILLVLLAASLAFSLASCSESSGKKNPDSAEEIKIEALSATELYKKGIEKNNSLTTAKYLTEIYFGEEKIEEITTIRKREGYDGFSYSRSGNDFYAFGEGKAYIKNASGAFTAPSTARAFAEYMAEYLFPVFGFSSEDFSLSSVENRVVSYEIAESAVLPLFSSALPAEKGDFSPKAISGKATFDEEAVLIAEEYTVSGEGEFLIQIKTRLEEYRNSAIEPLLPAEGEEFLELEDIRLPQMIQHSADSLLALDAVQATVVRSENFSLSSGKFSLHRDINLYQSGAGENLLYYRSLQSLKQIPEQEEESRFLQKRIEGNTFVQNEYNLITAEKLFEESGNASLASWSEDVLALMPAFSDFDSLAVEEDSASIGIRFVLTASAAEKIVRDSAALFPELGEIGTVPPSSSSGTILIEKESGRISALSFVVRANALCGEEAASYSGEFSITIDQTEGIVLPELQVPTPTTPGMHGDHDPNC